MQVKVITLADGHGPSETLIGIRTKSGDVEQVIVSKRIVKSDAIEVGLALAEEEGNVLIELPRESTRGKWRIWISASEIEHSRLEAAE